jgi:hypothetical protein
MGLFTPFRLKPDARPARRTLMLSMLGAEVLGLRQSLAEVKANRDELRREMDDLRRDRDHWRKLAEPLKPSGAGPKTWFCGRASAGA